MVGTTKMPKAIKATKAAPAAAASARSRSPPRDPTTRELIFPDAPRFRPNLTPAEVLRGGAFGGGYFRNITSAVAKRSFTDTWKELPASWLDGLNVENLVARQTYSASVNKFKTDCGFKLDARRDPFGLQAWETSGWIVAQDPYGWFQWFCRFYQGRRSDDDDRQMKRWAACASPTGRWRNNLITKVLASKQGLAGVDDPAISPVVRQTLWHWAYTLTARDLMAGAARKGAPSKADLAATAKAKKAAGQKAPVPKAAAKKSAKKEMSASVKKKKR